MTRSHLYQIIQTLFPTSVDNLLPEVVSSTADVLATVHLSALHPFSISETRDKYQHPPFICQGLQPDRNPLSLNVTIPHKKQSHSQMRYVTWTTEVAMLPVCGRAQRLMGNEGGRPFVLPLKEPAG